MVQPASAFTGIENLVVVNQLADGDTIRIDGTANNDVFEVTPGVTPDTGSIAGTMGVGGAASFTLPNVSYSGVSFATAAGGGLPATTGRVGINTTAATQGGVDTIVYNGTSANDIFTVANENVTLTSAAWGGPNTPAVLFGSSANTTTVNIVINAAQGDDRINMVSASAGAETYDFNGGNPDAGSDSLAFVDPGAAQTVAILPDPVDPTQQDVTGYSANATPIDVTGFELITYTGAGRNDTLTVTPNTDDDEIRIENQSVTTATASVTSQTLPEIHFTGLNVFNADSAIAPPNAGALEATFVTRNLDPATAYIFNGNSEDALIIEGADSFPDNYVVSNAFALGATGAATLITDMSTAPGPVVAVANGFTGLAPLPTFTPGEIRLHTKAGDDIVTIDTGGGGATAGAVYAAHLRGRWHRAARPGRYPHRLRRRHGRRRAERHWCSRDGRCQRSLHTGTESDVWQD